MLSLFCIMTDKMSMSQKGLCLSPSDYFLEMVDLGLQKRRIETIPAVRVYLVDILNYYLHASNLFDEIPSEMNGRRFDTLAEQYLIASRSSPSERQSILKKLGDKALYMSGFFRDFLEGKMVAHEYYASIGGAAYSSLANCAQEELLTVVYKSFARRFSDFAEVLNFISQESMVQSDQSLLKLYDRYLRTGSASAQEKLVEMGIFPLPKDQLNLGRQD